MGRSGKSGRKRGKRDIPAQSAARRGPARGTARLRRKSVEPGAVRRWVADKRPILRFVLVFGLLLGGFNAVFYLWLSRGDLFESYLNLNAEASAAVLRLFGDRATVTGTSILGSRFSLDIKRGCDAIQASAFFVFGVLASPVPVSLLSRVVPLAVGTLLLLLTNLARIVSLYYVGVYYPDAFQVMHVDVWQAVFIFLPLFLWVMWARRASRHATARLDVST